MRKSLTETEARDLLASNTVGRLGCIVDGEPYVVPINYVFENDFIYSHSLPGRKIDGLRVNRRACLQLDEIDSEMEWRSVIAYGVFEEVVLQSERRAFLAKLLARFPKLTPVESVMAHDAAAPDAIVFRLRIDHITGVAEE
ncbi:MAG TPA: pyridoxamine 5'-phosphate oxidase family protein [Pyrinomonadaceae bacterium]|jgi:hypothetical protein